MKKNRMMRLASILLVCVLLTTSVISGTFAKYVTTAESTDSARVAKWGITMALEEGIVGNSTETFVASYDAGVTAGDETVKTSGTDDVVAPGTKGAIKYVVDGTPETDYKITFDGTTTAAVDIYLGEGTYTYAAAANDNVTYVGMNATITDATVYYPLDWQVTIKTNNGTVYGAGWTKNVARQFATLEAAMEALSANDVYVTYKNNIACDLEVLIEWEWDFDTTSGDITQTTYTSNDVNDTILGDLAAKTAGALVDLTASDGSKYSLNVSYTLKMTAEQVD